MKKWRIQTKSIVDLVPHPKNPRQFTEKGMKDLGRSIDAFGLAEPIVVNSDDTIIGGHARVMVLKQRGETECECYVPDRQLSEKEVEQLMIRLNANQAGIWDTERLANEWDLSELMDWGLDPINFGQPEATEDDYEMPDEIITSIKRGDLFQIGEHYLLCGDSTKVEDVEKLMNGEKADMIFTDPPYGINYDDSRWNEIQKKHTGGNSKKFGVIKNDEASYDPSFLLSFFEYCKEIFVWGMQYYPQHLGRGGCIVWNRKTENQKDVPYIDFELCWSKQERNKMAWIVWGGFNNKENGGERVHPMQKPISLAKFFFNNWGKEKDLVVDLFLGSGSTMVAAHQLNRRCFGMEIDEKYCQVIIDRMKKAFPDIEIKRNGITCDINDLKQKDISLPV